VESRATVLIDLGDDRGLPDVETPPSPGSRRVSVRWLAGLLSGLLVVFGVTAAAPPDGALRPVGGLDVPAESTYFVADDVLLVSAALAGTTRSGSARSCWSPNSTRSAGVR
jgi:hypothetical protein